MRSLFPLRGGVHPPRRKELSNHQPIERLPLPTRLTVPLQQHIGAPAEPSVVVGESVLRGQLIASPGSRLGAPIHAPASGTVVAIEEHPLPHPLALHAPCIVIDCDLEQRQAPPLFEPVDDFTRLDSETIIERIRTAGIVGMGGAGFPSWVKLQTGGSRQIETVILNGAECEPYITCDDRLMRERADEIIRGLRILQHALQAKRSLVAIEADKPEAIAAIAEAIAAQDQQIELVRLPTRYPAGGEKQLIQIMLGREVPFGKLSLDIGVVTHNVGTAHAVSRAVLHGEPLLERVVTVTGAAVSTPCNLLVPLGTPAFELLDHCGREAGGYQKLLCGGPMMGFALYSEQVPITKTVNCLLAAAAGELGSVDPERPCIRCGQCAEACPVGLLPQQLFWFAQARELDRCEEHQIFSCIECGACAYVCPSRLPLVHYYRFAKQAIQLRDHQREQAEQARRRFEFRERRLERAKAEKAARHKERAQAVAGDSNDDKQAAIQAALARAEAKKAARASTNEAEEKG